MGYAKASKEENKIKRKAWLKSDNNSLKLCEEKEEKTSRFWKSCKKRASTVQLLLKGKQNSQQHPGENTKKTVSSPVKIQQKQSAAR